MATTIQHVTTKERLHQLVDELTEQEAGDALRYVASRREGSNVDEWGDLRAMNEFAATETMRRLAEEERAAGFPPWEREIDAAIIESYTRMPEDPPDEWGDLSKQTDARMAEAMKELTAEERTAGFGPRES